MATASTTTVDAAALVRCRSRYRSAAARISGLTSPETDVAFGEVANVVDDEVQSLGRQRTGGLVKTRHDEALDDRRLERHPQAEND